jgi:preprotein translocase subunit SecA
VALLDQLGLKEDECIEHSMVTKAMANARAKIESRVKNEITARSEGEWFLKNVKK